MLFMFRVLSIIVITFILINCCNPEKPKITIKPFYMSQNIDLKGFDTNCDGDIDYWQHYRNGKEFGSKIYTERIYQANDVD